MVASSNVGFRTFVTFEIYLLGIIATFENLYDHCVLFENFFLGQDYPGQEVCSALSGGRRCSFSLPWLQKRKATTTCSLASGELDPC